MGEHTATDAALVAAAAHGGAEAFRVLYRRHVRAVYWIAHGLLCHAADAEEVTQETFVTAWRKLAGVTLAGDSALPWLATICRFQAANLRRRRIRERERAAGVVDETVPAAIDVEKRVVDAALVERILQEVAGMTEIDRGIFRLCLVDGYGYAEAADRLGVSHGVVRTRLSRLRTRLRTTAEEGTT